MRVVNKLIIGLIMILVFGVTYYRGLAEAAEIEDWNDLITKVGEHNQELADALTSGSFLGEPEINVHELAPKLVNAYLTTYLNVTEFNPDVSQSSNPGTYPDLTDPCFESEFNTMFWDVFSANIYKHWKHPEIPPMDQGMMGDELWMGSAALYHLGEDCGPEYTEKADILVEHELYLIDQTIIRFLSMIGKPPEDWDLYFKDYVYPAGMGVEALIQGLNNYQGTILTQVKIIGYAELAAIASSCVAAIVTEDPRFANFVNSLFGEVVLLGSAAHLNFDLYEKTGANCFKNSGETLLGDAQSYWVTTSYGSYYSSYYDDNMPWDFEIALILNPLAMAYDATHDTNYLTKINSIMNTMTTHMWDSSDFGYWTGILHSAKVLSGNLFFANAHILLYKATEDDFHLERARNILQFSQSILYNGEGHVMHDISDGILDDHYCVGCQFFLIKEIYEYEKAKPPDITVTSPAAGEDWLIYNTKTIRWTSSGVTDNVKIELARPTGCGLAWSTIASSISNTGSYNWPVQGPAKNNCKIRICSLDNPDCCGESPSFDIVLPTITVTSPATGEDWGINSSKTIRWSSLGVNGNVNIKLGRPSGCGLAWSTIASSISNTGSYNWLVQGPAQNNCKIRITSIAHTDVYGESGSFDIVSTTTSSTTTTVANQPPVLHSFTATSGDYQANQQISFSFSASDDHDSFLQLTKKYQVWIYPDQNGEVALLQDCTVWNSSSDSYTIPGWSQPGMYYLFRGQVWDTGGLYSYYIDTEWHDVVSPPLPEPTNLRVTDTTGSSITWQWNSVSGAYYYKPKIGSSCPASTWDYLQTETSYTRSVLNLGQMKCLQVKACNEEGANCSGLTNCICGFASTMNITSISPTSGSEGTKITIRGSNFGTKTSYSSVDLNPCFYNSRPAQSCFPYLTELEIVSWSNTKIEAKVPSGALAGQHGVFVWKSSNDKAYAGDFTVQ